MYFKYQIIFLGDIANPACEAIRRRFYEKTSEIGLPADSFLEIYSGNFAACYQNKQPSFVYYFGKKGHCDLDTDKLEFLMNNGDAIMPVFLGRTVFSMRFPRRRGR